MRGFEYSWCLWSLALLPVVAVCLGASRRRARRALSAVRSWAAAASSLDARRSLRDGVLLAALALLSLAAAGPGERRESSRPPVLVALDVSLSMNARDVDGGPRLQAARAALTRLLGRLEGRRVGLLLFAGEARLQVPFTSDLAAIELLAGEAGSGEVARAGTDIAAAVDEALRAQLVPADPPVMVLLTDGETTEGDLGAAAERAQRAGMRVHTLGIGSLRGSTVPSTDALEAPPKLDRAGQVVVSRVDEDALRRLAQRTGGRFVRWTGTEAADQLADALDAGGGPAAGNRVPLRDLLLGLAVALLVIETALPQRPLRPWVRVVRSPARLAAGLCALLVLLPATASAQTPWLDIAAGRYAFRQGRLDKAAAAFRRAVAREDPPWQAWFDLGCVHLQAARHEDALAAFEAAASRAHGASEKALIQYNRGEVLARLHRLGDAAEAYMDVLRFDPRDEDARHNLAVVRARARQEAPQSSPQQERRPESAAHAASSPLQDQMSDEEADRLLREADSRERQARRRAPGAESPGRPAPEKDW